VIRRGVRVDPPKGVLQNFLGVSYLLRESNPPDPPPLPSNTALLMLREKVSSRLFECAFCTALISEIVWKQIPDGRTGDRE